MNVCFVSWGNRHNEILLPLLDLTVVRLYSLFLLDPPTMESNLLDRITLTWAIVALPVIRYPM